MSRPTPDAPARADQHHFMGSEQSPVMITLVLIATLGVLAYTGFLLNPANRGDLVPYLMVLSAELVLVLHALMTSWTILAGGQNPRTYAVHHARSVLYAHTHGEPTRWPLMLAGRPVTVDILITVYGEPLDVIERTATAARDMRGEHRTWILDDGRSDDVKELASRLGVRYVRRLTSHGAKAGNVNHALTLAKGEAFAIFDADFVPKPEFIEQTLPFFVDHKVAFVQTPQSYGNEDESVISKGAAYMQTVFYRFVQPGKNRFNAAFCVGTNVMFRREAVLDVGGIYTDSKSEDVWTSLMMHERGWKSIFIPEVLAVGDAPDNVEAFSKQQLRWATGGFEILFTHPLFSRRSKLSLEQRIQYLTTASFYLTGIAPLPLLLVPPLEIFFDLRPVSLSITIGEWALFYAGFYVMQILLAWFALGTYKWQTLTLATVSFPVYTKALFNVLRGKDVGWQATGTLKQSSAFNYMIPQMLFFAFLLIASVVAIWRDFGNGFLTLATVWNILNTAILGVFVVSAGMNLKPRASKKAAKTTEVPAAPAADDLDNEIAALLELEGEIAPGAMPIGARDRIAARALAATAPDPALVFAQPVGAVQYFQPPLPYGSDPIAVSQAAAVASIRATTMAARALRDAEAGPAPRIHLSAVPDPTVPEPAAPSSTGPAAGDGTAAARHLVAPPVEATATATDTDTDTDTDTVAAAGAEGSGDDATTQPRAEEAPVAKETSAPASEETGPEGPAQPLEPAAALPADVDRPGWQWHEAGATPTPSVTPVAPAAPAAHASTPSPAPHQGYPAPAQYAPIVGSYPGAPSQASPAAPWPGQPLDPAASSPVPPAGAPWQSAPAPHSTSPVNPTPQGQAPTPYGHAPNPYDQAPAPYGQGPTAPPQAFPQGSYPAMQAAYYATLHDPRYAPPAAYDPYTGQPLAPYPGAGQQPASMPPAYAYPQASGYGGWNGAPTTAMPYAPGFTAPGYPGPAAYPGYAPGQPGQGQNPPHPPGAGPAAHHG